MADEEKRDTMVLCFANNKGGSGKSTTCANVGYALSQQGQRVLLVDGDMQLDLSLSFFPEERVLEMAQQEKNLYHAIRLQQPLTDGYIVPTPYPGLDLVPSSTLMSGIEYELFTKWQREFVLKKCLQPVRDSGKYDYIRAAARPAAEPAGRGADEGLHPQELLPADAGRAARDGRRAGVRQHRAGGQHRGVDTGQQPSRRQLQAVQPQRTGVLCVGGGNTPPGAHKVICYL